MGPEANVGKCLLSGLRRLLKPSESVGEMFRTSCSSQSNVSIPGAYLLLFLKQWASSSLFFHLPTKEVGEHLLLDSPMEIALYHSQKIKS